MKITVLHISPAPPQIGGMETFMGELLQSALRRKVRLIHLDISKPALQKGGSYGIGTGYTAVRQRGLGRSAISYGCSICFFYRFIKLLLTKRIDILHIHTASYTSFWEKCLYILIGRMTGKKVILHIHGALFDEFYQSSSSNAQSLIRFFIAHCHAVIVLSPSWLGFFQKILPFGKFYIVENGINLAPYHQLPQNSGKTTFLHIGEISQRKGIEDVLAASAACKALGYDFSVHLAGGGELVKYGRLIEELGLNERVTLHGPTRGPAKIALFTNSNVFVLASYAEGLPIALIEAMAAGMPIISTTVGGIPDVIQSGVHGFLCTPGDRRKLLEHFVSLIREPKLRKKMGKTNRLYAANRFDIERCAKQILEIYQKITAYQ